MKSAIMKKVVINGIDRYMWTCPTCGCIESAMFCLSDKASACESREVICKCICGEIVTYAG